MNERLGQFQLIIQVMLPVCRDQVQVIERASAEGWCWFINEREKSWYIGNTADSESLGIYNDDQAYKFVEARALAGSKFHQHALAALAAANIV